MADEPAPLADLVRWEYWFFKAYGDHARDLRELNELGSEGWEVVGLVHPGRLLMKRLIDGSGAPNV